MVGKVRWQDLSAQTKMRFAVMGAIQIALFVAALWDIRRRPATEIRGRKGLWMAISFINFIGPIAYFIFGRKPEALLPDEVVVS